MHENKELRHAVVSSLQPWFSIIRFRGERLETSQLPSLLRKQKERPLNKDGCQQIPVEHIIHPPRDGSDTFQLVASEGDSAASEHRGVSLKDALQGTGLGPSLYP